MAISQIGSILLSLKCCFLSELPEYADEYLYLCNQDQVKEGEQYAQTNLFLFDFAGALLLTGCGVPGEADATTPAPTASAPPSESSAAAQTTSPSTAATAAEQTSAVPETDPIPAETTLADPWTRLVDEWRTKTLPLEAGEDGRLVAEFMEAYFAAFENLTPEDSPFAYSDSAVLSFMLPQVAQERIPETGENALLLIAPVRYAIQLYESWLGRRRL